MFPSLPERDPGADAIEKLARRLIRIAGESDESLIPAGYTYFAQFVDHDITFDPTSKLQRDNDPHALADFRTPRFDLDSLYGSGPIDQPFLYDWDGSSDAGVKLLIGRNPRDGTSAHEDLPRNQRGRALIGDARNDENLIVAQLHLLFIRFHNRVVDHVRRELPGLSSAELFEEAQRIVRWHYQWIVTHDFLRRIVGEDMARAVLPPDGRRRFFKWREAPFMPVEFSAAAFRFGHSMVREDYVVGTEPGVPILRPRKGSDLHLGGFRRLPHALQISWSIFFKTTAEAPLMRSMLIDTSLVEALCDLPPDGAALARLNLERGRAVGLPAGADVAHAIGEAPLTDDELQLGGVAAPAREALLRATPLWYYVLREADARANGAHLGPVGGRIVAEVLVGLLEGDPSSYLRQWPAWKPGISKAEPGSGERERAPVDDFTMADLVRFAEGK
jgi:hypothetical protein